MVLKSSPSSSEDALTSMRSSQTNLRRQYSKQPGLPTMDRFLSHLGNPGRYQIIIMVLLAANCIPVVVNHLLMTFYAVKTPHNCRVPDDANKSLWLPKTDNGSMYSSAVKKVEASSSTTYATCEMYKNPQNHSLGTQPCVDGYEFHMDNNEWNIISEWGLVCDREFVGPLITTTYFCGVMLGGIFFGSLSDKFGRKNMMLICLYTQCVIGIGIHFVRRLVVFIGLRFIQGIFIQGLQCVTYSMVMELFSRQYRAMAGCVIEAFWALGVILLAIIAKYVQHWRYIQLAINIPTMATIFYIWIVPESVRWLLSRGKFARAETIVRIIASNNSLRLDPIWIREEMEEVGRVVVLQDPPKYPDIRILITHRAIRKNAFVLFFVWFAVSLSYYGIAFSIPNLSGDRYFNFMIGGGIELAAYILAFVVINSFGRKFPLMIYLQLSGVLCVSVVCIKDFMPSSWLDVEALATALALIGKASIVSCFCIIFIYSSELFPTVIRTVGVGCCAFWGRVGSLLAPQILLAGKKLYPKHPDLLSFITFGGLSLLAGLCTLCLPETGDEDLPDTVAEAEHIGEHKKTEQYDDNTLVRSEDCAPTQYSESLQGEETGYGKSPEWVEVDGMIVSRGSGLGPGSTLTNSLNNTNSTSMSGGGGGHGVGGLPPHPHVHPHHHGGHHPVGVGAGGHQASHGSVLSLPYSSRTQLTYNSTSSTQRSSGRSNLEAGLDTLEYPMRLTSSQQPPLRHNHEVDYEDEEPPYETIPSVPPNINITLNEQFGMNNHLMTTEAMINPEATDSLTSDPMRSGNSSMLMHQDTSVISAHDVAHTGIYDILGRLPMPPPNASSKMNNGGGHGVSYIENQRPNSIDPVQGYFFRKKLLMQDANETRL